MAVSGMGEANLRHMSVDIAIESQGTGFTLNQQPRRGVQCLQKHSITVSEVHTSCPVITAPAVRGVHVHTEYHRGGAHCTYGWQQHN